MIKINKVDHLNINVSNLKNSINFYQKLFGFKEYETGVSQKGNSYSIIGEAGSFFLCLYEGKSSSQKEKVLNHFGINISNFDETITKLQNEKIELLYGGVVTYPRSRSVYISDPDNNEIELSEVFGGGFN